MDLAAARAAALKLLERRRYSVAEMRRKLTQRGCESAVVQAVLDGLLRARLLDDTAYAQAYVHDGVLLKGHGRHRLTADLRRRGIAPELIDAALATWIADDTELALARDLAVQRLSRLRGLEPAVARRRLAGYLQRRGLPVGVVVQVLSELDLPREGGNEAE
ncbi:MAG: regulatory protein RecX [Fimbriimonadaceae bacterium]|nr:regulatory protein RecX [Fimbriimonadaceae bacterium]